MFTANSIISQVALTALHYIVFFTCSRFSDKIVFCSPLLSLRCASPDPFSSFTPLWTQLFFFFCSVSLAVHLYLCWNMPHDLILCTGLLTFAPEVRVSQVWPHIVFQVLPGLKNNKLQSLQCMARGDLFSLADMSFHSPPAVLWSLYFHSPICTKMCVIVHLCLYIPDISRFHLDFGLCSSCFILKHLSLWFLFSHFRFPFWIVCPLFRPKPILRFFFPQVPATSPAALLPSPSSLSIETLIYSPWSLIVNQTSAHCLAPPQGIPLCCSPPAWPSVWLLHKHLGLSLAMLFGSDFLSPSSSEIWTCSRSRPSTWGLWLWLCQDPRWHVTSFRSPCLPCVYFYGHCLHILRYVHADSKCLAPDRCT